MFVDESNVDAPRESVFAILADAHSYPTWWKPVYLGVKSEGESEVGKESLQHFKGRLPYHLHTRSQITRLEPPFRIHGELDGDLRGTGLWTLSENADHIHPRPLRLAGPRRPAAAQAPHPDPAAGPAPGTTPGPSRGRGFYRSNACPLLSCRRSSAHHSSMRSPGRRRLVPVTSSNAAAGGGACSGGRAAPWPSPRSACPARGRRAGCPRARAEPPERGERSRWRSVKAAPSASSERIAGRIERSARLNVPSWPKASAVWSARLACANAPAARRAARAARRPPRRRARRRGLRRRGRRDRGRARWSACRVRRGGAPPSSARARKATYSRRVEAEPRLARQLGGVDRPQEHGEHERVAALLLLARQLELDLAVRWPTTSITASPQATASR